MRVLPSRLLAVTDRHGSGHPLTDTVQAILDGGVRWVWFRDRDLEPEARRHLGFAVAERVRAAGGFLTIGGDIALAQALGADGVHLGGGTGAEWVAAARASLGPHALIGISAHAPAEVEAAAAAGADYVTLSPIYPTASKPDYGPALGPEGIGAALHAGLPVVALGGIMPARIPACREAGAAGVAVLGELMRAPDPAAVARDILAAWAA